MTRVYPMIAAAVAGALLCALVATSAGETRRDAQSDVPASCSPAWSTAAGQPGFDGWIYTMHVWDDGTGPALYVGGLFNTAGGRLARGVAKWDGFDWRPLGEGASGLVMAIENFDDGTGDALYVGGVFEEAGGKPAANIAKWDPRTRTWSDVGGGLSGPGQPIASVISLVTFDDGSGPALYAGGTFATAGGREAANIARWNEKEWSAVGGGVSGAVRSFVVLDDGAGQALYAGGLFDQAGAVRASRMARWDGREWHALTGEFQGPGIRTMTVHDGEIYVGGLFRGIDDIQCNNLAKWDPRTDSWSNLSEGANERVVDMRTFDDGSGAQVYATGWFTRIGGRAVRHIAKWDGTQWQPLDSKDLNWLGRALAEFPEASSGRVALYVGGGFNDADGRISKRVAAWVGCRAAARLEPSDEPLGRVPTPEDLDELQRTGRGARSAPPPQPQGRDQSQRPSGRGQKP